MRKSYKTKVNELLTSAFLVAVAIALLNWMGTIRALLNLPVFYKVLTIILGLIILTGIFLWKRGRLGETLGHIGNAVLSIILTVKIMKKF